VRLERKVAISSHIALCQTAYRSASKNARGSEEGECSTHVEAGLAAVKATEFAVFGCRGLRTIGCLLISGGDAGENGGSERSMAADKKIDQP
jgi:hypothetical protein